MYAVAAYSFAKGHRKNAKQTWEDGPGPGTYQISKPHNTKPPQWKIGSEDRKGKRLNNNPGPGSYNELIPKSKRDYPQYSFGSKTQSGFVGSGITPGPGAYEKQDDKVQKASQQYSFGLKLTNQSSMGREKTDGPGPALYETNVSSVANRPSSKMSRQHRGDMMPPEARFVPGVGNYELRPQSCAPQTRFGTERRGGEQSEAFPGPGNYTVGTNMQNPNLGKTMGMRIQSGTKSGIKEKSGDNGLAPGPGQYELSYGEGTNIGCRIGSEARDKTYSASKNRGIPGPGQYDYRKQGGVGWKIGKEQRGKQNNQYTPGPGAYDWDSRDEQFGVTSKKFSFGIKQKHRETDETPGPQNYEPLLLQTKSRPASCKVGTQSRGHYQYNDTPAPNQYQITNVTLGPQHKIPIQLRNQTKQDYTPGPGQYDIPDYLGEVPEYLIPNRKEMKQQKYT